ncbi:hypothetical protein GCM10011508_19040 [Flavobacterium lutivivi]|nr:hypothetical protein GCM10011508_19040 [Flavobacterium lutivivi]
MKKIIVLFSLFIAFGCKKEEKQAVVANDKMTLDENQKLYGNWVGDFIITEADSLADESDYVYNNKLNLVIKKIENFKAFGQSIVAGNSRPLIGSFSEYNGEYRFTFNEPGNNSNDGKFTFKIVDDTLKGTWTANDRKNKVLSRKFVLTKQNFKYNPNLMLPDDTEYVDWYSEKLDSVKEVIDDEEETYYEETYRTASDIITKLNASTTLLSENDLKNLKKLELEIIRNTIFARHGYSFKKKSFRQFFDPVDWYIPVTDDMSGKLTLIEQKNIVLLNLFQKYAEDNYDSFGR